MYLLIFCLWKTCNRNGHSSPFTLARGHGLRISTWHKPCQPIILHFAYHFYMDITQLDGKSFSQPICVRVNCNMMAVQWAKLISHTSLFTFLLKDHCGRQSIANIPKHTFCYWQKIKTYQSITVNLCDRQWSQQLLNSLWTFNRSPCIHSPVIGALHFHAFPFACIFSGSLFLFFFFFGTRY